MLTYVQNLVGTCMQYCSCRERAKNTMPMARQVLDTGRSLITDAGCAHLVAGLADERPPGSLGQPALDANLSQRSGLKL